MRGVAIQLPLEIHVVFLLPQTVDSAGFYREGNAFISRLILA